MRNLILGKATLSLGCAAVILFGAINSRAETIYTKKPECRVQAYQAYNDLAYYHLYSYWAGLYLEMYFRNPKKNADYLQYYFMYSNISWNYYFYYWYDLQALDRCENPPKPVYTYTSTSTSVSTLTAANGSVITTTSVSVSTKTATAK